MILFLAAVGAGCGLIYQTLLGIFLVNPPLNGAILAVILVGIALNFRQVLLLAPEARWIDKFRESADRSEETLGDQRTEGAEVELRLLSPMARMLAERRTRGRLMLSAPAMRTLLDGIASRLDEGRELSRYFTGLCIFLGLLGTFWGLLGTVSSVSGVIGSLNVGSTDASGMFEELKKGLQTPLAGMGTAFSSSLFGLGGSLVLGFLDLQAGQAQNKFFNELEEWLSGVTRLSSGAGPSDSEQGVSAYTEALLEQTAERLEELERVLTRSEQARLSSSEQMADLSARLGALADQMRTETQVLLKLAEAQKDMAPVLKKLADAPATAIDDTSRGHLRSIDAAITRMASGVEAGREEIVRELRTEIKLLAKTVASAARDVGEG
ncbi:MAG: flagellar motor protein MotA [Alphaproteobacteria bacterium]|nr:flagellar motor protein MotA [Alphaproteobacteria bacterium]